MTHDEQTILAELSTEWSYTVRELADELQLSEDRIAGALKRLESAGLARREANTHPANWWKV